MRVHTRSVQSHLWSSFTPESSSFTSGQSLVSHTQRVHDLQVQAEGLSTAADFILKVCVQKKGLSTETSQST